MDLIFLSVLAGVAMMPIIFLIMKNNMSKVPIETEFCHSNRAISHFPTLENFEGKKIRIKFKGKVVAEKNIKGKPVEVRTGTFTRKRRYYAMEGVPDTIDPFTFEKMIGSDSPLANFKQKMMMVIVDYFEAIQLSLRKGKISLFQNIFWLPLGLVIGLLMSAFLKISIG